MRILIFERNKLFLFHNINTCKTWCILENMPHSLTVHQTVPANKPWLGRQRCSCWNKTPGSPELCCRASFWFQPETILPTKNLGRSGVNLQNWHWTGVITLAILGVSNHTYINVWWFSGISLHNALFGLVILLMVQKSQTTTWDGAKTLWILGYLLHQSTSTG